jgi:signal transduction histidine kinase
MTAERPEKLASATPMEAPAAPVMLRDMAAAPLGPPAWQGEGIAAGGTPGVHREADDAALRQAQRLDAIGRLSGGLAHDFNNLLTAIGGSLELLDRHVTTAAGRRLLDTARRAAHRGGELTGKLLAFSRNQHLAPRAVDLNRLLGQARAAIERALGPKIAIETALASDLAPAMVDPAQIELALLHLAANARDAMPEGGRVTIGTRNAVAPDKGAPADLPPGGYVAVSVTDTGAGIEPRLLNRVLEPFFTTKDAGVGSGLGLSVVYGTVKQSGGSLRIESAARSGTRVELFLPRARGP